MNDNEERKPDSSSETGDADPGAQIEDSFEAARRAAEMCVPEEAPEDFDPSARALEEEPDDGAPETEKDDDKRTYVESADDDVGDANRIPDDDDGKKGAEPAEGEANWGRELSTRRIALELRNVEFEVRRLLADRDPRRKRRLAGTRRWLELEEDILSLRYTGRIDESILLELQNLIARRHHLFRRLSFVASTRPTWNS